MEKILRVGDDSFEIVNKVPLGYEIWNIGRNMPDGYLPFCRLSQHQPFPGARNIETDTLKAIKCEGAQLILAAIGSGIKTVKEMESYVAKNKNAKQGTVAHGMVQKFKAALPFMKSVAWPTV